VTLAEVFAAEEATVLNRDVALVELQAARSEYEAAKAKERPDGDALGEMRTQHASNRLSRAVRAAIAAGVPRADIYPKKRK